MKNNRIFNYNNTNIPNLSLIIFGVLLCLFFSLIMDYKALLYFGITPIILLAVIMGLSKNSISLIILFALNYLIMGITRYIHIPIPITNVFDILYSIILGFIILRQIYQNDNFSNVLNVYTLLLLVWFLYCSINIGNNVTGEVHIESWIRTIRPLAIYPLLTCILISICAKKYTFIYYFLLTFAIFSFLGAFKGIWQKVQGFDNAEYIWVSTIGATTHLIHSGIRYFSFFTDAANFGCSMGFSFVTFFITSLFTKNKIYKLIFLITSFCAIYGLLISGTRAAIAVPFVGLAIFTILARNTKLILFSLFCLIFSFFILKFTTIGNSNPYIRRMRSALNVEDASLQVRLENQKALKSYMKEAPFGIGIGVLPSDISVQNKFYFVSICAPDSDLVYIWMRLGIVGLSVYLIIQLLIYSIASYILLFRIRNSEIRGPLIAMLCGSAGLLVASYANQISFQFPNGLLIYTCLTLVYLGPFFDKQYSKDHDEKQINISHNG